MPAGNFRSGMVFILYYTMKKELLITISVVFLSLISPLTKVYPYKPKIMLKVNDQNFEQEALKETKPVLVYFYSDSGQPAAKNMLPALDSIATRHSDKIKVCYYKIGKDDHYWRKYITYSGTNVVFKNGKKIMETSTWGSVKVNQEYLLLF